MLNKFMTHQDATSEQNLLEGIVIEAIQARGLDMYYIPRDILKGKKFTSIDDIFLDVINQDFPHAFDLEMYMENSSAGFAGQGDIMSKFGLQTFDELKLTVAKKRWHQVVGQNLGDDYTGMPNEGDLIYMKLTNKMWQIQHVEREAEFYQLGALYTYQFSCVLFDLSNEDFDTTVPNINKIESLGYRFIMKIQPDIINSNPTIKVGDNVKQVLEEGDSAMAIEEIAMHGEVLEYDKPNGILTLVHVGSSDKVYRVFDEASPIQIGEDITNMFEIISTSQKLSDHVYQDEESDINTITPDNPTGDLNQFSGRNASPSFIDTTEENLFGSPFNKGKR